LSVCGKKSGSGLSCVFTFRVKVCRTGGKIKGTEAEHYKNQKERAKKRWVQRWCVKYRT